MFSSFFNRYLIVLREQSIELFKTDRDNKNKKLIATCDCNSLFASSWSYLSEQIEELIKKNKVDKGVIAVVFPNNYARIFTTSPPKNISSLSDLRAAVNMRFQSLYGDSPNNWKIAADWSASYPFLTCAIPTDFLQAVIATTKKCGLTLVSLMPSFVHEFNRRHKSIPTDTWLVALTSGLVSIGVVIDHRLNVLRESQAFNADQSISWLLTHVKKEALRLNMPAPLALHVFSGDQSGSIIRLDETKVSTVVSGKFSYLKKRFREIGARTVKLNFIDGGLSKSAATITPLSIVAGFIGICLCGFLLESSLTNFSQISKQEKVLNQTESPRGTAILRPSPQASIAAPEKIRAVNAAVQQLNLPWSEMLNGIEQATPSTIALLTLSPDAKRSVLNITAEAKTSDDMLAYVEGLNRDRFFSSALLTRHEVNAQDAHKPFRFYLQASWGKEAQ